MVPTELLIFTLCVTLGAVKQLRYMKSHLLGLRLRRCTKMPLVLKSKTYLEYAKKHFLLNRRYQLKMKETFDKKKVGRKDVDEFQTGELVWFNVRRRMPDMKYNKAKWIGPCKVVSVSEGGLFKLSYEVNGEFIKYDCIHPQFLKRFCGEPLLIAS